MLGLYRPGDRGLHRLHPLTKLAVVFSIIILAFGIPRAFLPPALFLGAVVPLALWGGIARALLRALALVMAPLAFSLFLVHSFLYPGGQTSLVVWGPLAATKEGVGYAFLVSSRLAVMVGASLLLLLSTQPGTLVAALMARGLPPSFGYVILAAMQMIPLLQARAMAIQQAQQARGLELAGSPLRRARALLPLLAPLLLGALLSGEQRALALEGRAFRAKGPKTSLAEAREGPWEPELRLGLLLGSVALVVAGRWLL